ncbi:GNAT family N-acetyltransferase [Clostridium disporicum]|uniref:Diamine acetyltransferase 1 n=1 Tax=Clostridium disporicum TaxID=84024 RepID=A0A173Z6D1_9CLOT|nr:GNAT family N-acetyltransferase [Clostridium disporicum]CUN71353.1 diamine acetyltransferase 1 [Clostridium disporicum]
MRRYNTNIEGFTLRETSENDLSLILGFIKEIAEYEKLSHAVDATEESLKKYVFEKRRAEVLIVEKDENPIGYVVYFYNFSTFTGTSGLYLEDVFIRSEYRGMGLGKEIFKILGKLAREEGCKRMEWVCLNWNEPSKKFYKGLGAISMDEWTTFRLTEDYIRKL